MLRNGWGETLMPSHKIAKIGSDITKALSEIIFTEAKDELLKSITITGCKVSSDLSYAKVYFTSLSTLPKEKIVSEINESSSFLRTELANKIDIRHTPELTFVYDDSIEYGARIESIIKKIHEEK